MREERLYGPPGTGKTTTLTGLVAEACRTYGSDRVLVASFTKTAARELVGRNLPLDASQVGTLHALCFRALGSPKLATGSSVLASWNEQYPNYALGHERGDLDDLSVEVNAGEKGAGEELSCAYQILRGRLVDRDYWAPRVLAFATAWEEWKAFHGLLDFTDLVELCLKDTIAAPNAASILFLDEVQDFAPIELALARKWGRSMDRLVLAGDDDQCLYTFKGSTPEAFLEPAIADDQKRVLSQSYRVPRAVHRVASAWIEQVSKREPKAYRPRDFEGVVGLAERQWSSSAPEKILDELEVHLANGKTVAILASCSYMLDSMKKALRSAGVPFHNPYRLKRGDWNPLGARKNAVTSAERVLAYLKPSRDASAWWTNAELYSWASLLEVKGLLTRGAKGEMRTAADEKPNEPVDTEKLSGWFVDETAAGHAVAGSLAWFRERVLGSQEKVLEFPFAIVERRGVAALTTAPKVILGTIHSVKGGEADIVYLLPDLSPSAAASYHTTEGFDAIVRCFYVGITRAREALYWGHATGSGAAVSPMLP